MPVWTRRGGANSPTVLAGNKFSEAKKLCDQAMQELDALLAREDVSDANKKILNEVKTEFMKNMHDNQQKSAKSRADRLIEPVKQILERAKKIVKPDQSSAQPENGDHNVKNGNHHVRRGDNNGPHSADGEYMQLERSKEAGRALRHNNPDITDLSDSNRPTKLAERFSHLYDNEWTNAYDDLKKDRMKDTEIIQLLLAVVQKAYKFCYEEAAKQLRQMEEACTSILVSGSLQSTNTSQIQTKGNDYLKQFRKESAALSLKRLGNAFREQVKAVAHGKESKRLFEYGARAVELCWYMCVQDVPVFMVPTTTFDPAVYRAYTQNGTQLDYYVWPALKLHKDGGLLMKGVVQFKK